MQRLLFFTVFLLMSLKGFSQTLLDEYTSPISNVNYQIGNSILIGVPNYTKNENFLYTNVFIAQKGWNSYDRINENLSNVKGTIEQIYSYQEHDKREFENSVVLEIKIEGHDNLFVPIDKAILSKEVVVFSNPNSAIEHLPFNAQTSILLQIKAKKLSQETAMLEFVEKLEPKKFEEWKNNEFLFEAEKEQYIKDVDSVLEIVSIGDTFVLVMPVEIGDYNFDSNSFPIVETYTKFGEAVEFVFSHEKFSFKNYSDFSNIRVPRNKAEFFAKSSSKSYNGTRSAFVILNVKVNDVKFSEKRGGMNIGSSVQNIIEYSFSIVDMSCVDSESLWYNYLGED